MEANAAFIVEACNNYERLKAQNEKLRIAIAIARHAALEEAAKVAEQDHRSWLARSQGYVPVWHENALEIARRIRALQERGTS